jgi:hypothetical protein
MSCQVIISDHVINRRMTLSLDAGDFALQAAQWQKTDALLSAFCDHPFFAGCDHWDDLTLTHFHVLIINMLKICADHHDTEANNRAHPIVLRLNFLLCSLIDFLQQRSGSIIDLLRVNRVGNNEVLYDYSARLNVIFAPTKTGLRVVIDN